jgi:cytochrome c oxidase subunit II
MSKLYLLFSILVCLFVVVSFSAYAQEASVLEPHGEGARDIANLWSIMLVIAIGVYGQVISFFFLGLFRRRRVQENDSPDISPPSLTAQSFIIANGIAIPLVILVIVFGLNLATLLALSPDDANTDLRIEVIGHRWWWEVRYPDHSIITANEIYIPTGASVELLLTSVDVIHSFWVPSLNGKADLIPNQTNRMFLYTEEAGEYLGQCAELCGVQHAKMRAYVIALPPNEFEQWLSQQQQAAPLPEADSEELLRGQQIFLGSACVYCHTIRGTSASGVIGPDLTHLASRRTLGSGILPNTRGNLAGWIIDPQSVKPGNLMPPMYIEGDDLQALLAYLESLE